MRAISLFRLWTRDYCLSSVCYYMSGSYPLGLQEQIDPDQQTGYKTPALPRRQHEKLLNFGMHPYKGLRFGASI
jgi:hypothetical protein